MLAKVIGRIAVSLARRRIEVKRVQDWAAVLEKVAAEMRRESWRDGSY
jgi:hypothetical protein